MVTRPALPVSDTDTVAVMSSGGVSGASGKVSVVLDGVLTELSMFVLRLSHSGRAVRVYFPGEGQEAFLKGHTLAFERLGRVPARVRYDNLKAAGDAGARGT